MKINNSLALLVFVVLVLNSRYHYALEKQDDGIMIELSKKKATDAKMMKIQVCTENIIRVISAPEKAFSNRPSLIVNETEWQPVAWSMQEDGDLISISTAKVMLKIHREKGTVAFYNAEGKLILQEKADDSKIITPVEVMGEQTYHIQQLFDSPEEEAFYGLGQHQNNIMNYKGHDVDLWQHNCVAVVPFLFSSRNYGILWDNNSRTKLGDIRDFQSLASLKLYDKEGKEGGLTAEYFETLDFTSLFTSRREPRIEHEFIDINDAFPQGFHDNVASVRWSGEIECHESGVHKFRLYCSGYTKMWLNGELVVESWRQNWLPWTHLPRIEMEAGKRYSLKIEWVHSNGYIGLKYLPPEKEENKNSLSLYSEVADQIDYYFIHGDNL
ncbi:MAG: DUF4968 domain-containing protein, partial [bacterium]